jgi:hypothetical protein
VRFFLAIGICLLAGSAACAQFAAPGAGGAPFSAVSQTQIHPAVARIVVPGNGTISYGSGTLVYADETYGLVVTNWHVVNEAAGPISVHFPDGYYSLGSVQDVDRDWDLALVAIRRPNAAPVPLAERAPQPGEILTIAGYGSGQYRAASGACTQYVAPGLQFPYEMVEVAVSARQGDSGGPIFNSRGELAGVLFGEGDGRTSGSYCGRVRWFLSRIVPNLPDRSIMVAAAPLEPVGARGGQSSAAGEPDERSAREAARSRGFAPSPSKWQGVESRPDAGAPVVASTRSAEAAEADVEQIGWREIAGATWGEQAKTVLAGVGLLAIVLHLLAWLSRG